MDPPRKGHRLIVDFKSQFPEKLYDVANDGHLIYWNRNGSLSVKGEEEFEKNVMRLYPGFLQIPSFLNLKRLFREYGFDRNVNQNHEYEFSHPCFVHGRRDLTRNILTRRKSMRCPVDRSEAVDDEPIVFGTDEGKRYSTRKRKRTTRFNPHGDESQHSEDYEEGQGDTAKTYIISHTDMKRYPVKKPTIEKDNQNFGNESNVAQKSPESTSKINQLQVMMENFAEKEFTEQEYAEWLAKQRKLDALKKDSIKTVEKVSNKPKEFWWMYDDKEDPPTISETKDKQITLDDCMPCGFCKCCSAISNYVHIFGEIPENIQVFDYIVEVPEGTEIVGDSSLDVGNEVIIETQ